MKRRRVWKGRRPAWRRLTALIVCCGLVIASAPVIMAAHAMEFNRSPEHYLLKHADRLNLPDFVRGRLAQRIAPIPEERRYKPALIAPEFDERLTEIDNALTAYIVQLDAGQPAKDTRFSNWLLEVEQDLDSIEANYERLQALWDQPATSAVRERLFDQKSQFDSDVLRLRELLGQFVTAEGKNSVLEPSHLRAEQEWLRTKLRGPRRGAYRPDRLPLTNRRASPVAPAMTEQELQARVDPTGRCVESDSRAADPPPAPEDLTETIEVEFTQEIQDLAASLNNDALEIFEWVRNNIDFSAVWGSIQGADHCLSSRSCNDFDTASLLIALLRVSGIPARYQTGTVDVPETEAKDWVGGVDNLQTAGDIAASGGIPGVIYNGDRLRLERVWVRAMVDMNPSRGAVHVEGDTWVDMDPAFKRHVYVPPLDVSETVPFDEQVLEDAESTGTVDPVTGSVTSIDMTNVEATMQQHLDDVIVHLQTTMPGFENEDVGGGAVIISEQRNGLAGTLPFHVVTSSAPFASIPPSYRHTLNFKMEDEYGFTVFSETRSLPELAAKEIALVYRPATAADEAALQALLPADPDATPDQYPASLAAGAINVVPEVRVAGAVIVSGDPIGLGFSQEFILTFNGPFGGSRDFSATVNAGEYYAIGIDLERISDRQIERLHARVETLNAAGSDPDLAETLTADTSLGALLQAGIHSWFFERDMRGEMIARSQGAINQRLPSSGLHFSALSVETLFGIPQTVSNGGVTLDIPNDFLYVFAKDGDSDTAVRIALGQGQVGSELEASVQEEVLGTDDYPVTATSTMRILRQANSEGIPIYRVDNDNSATILPLLQYGADDLALVNSALAAGLEIIVPQTPVTFAGSQITGMITQDLASGSASYLISGGLGVHNGGLAELLDDPAIAFLISAIMLAVGVFAGGLLAVLLALGSIAFGVYQFLRAVDEIRAQGLDPDDEDMLVGVLFWFALVGGIVIALIGLVAGGIPGFIVGALAYAFYSIVVTMILIMIARLLGSMPDQPESNSATASQVPARRHRARA